LRFPGTIPQVEVAEQAYLGAMVDDLDVLIPHLFRQWCVGEGGRVTLWLGESCRAEAAHTVDPMLVFAIELPQRSPGGD
jgi:hypothetical protein